MTRRTRRRSSPALRLGQLFGTFVALAAAGLVLTAVAHLIIGGAW